MKMKNIINIGMVFAFIFVFTACEDLLETEPSDSKLTETFASIADAKLVANGLYGKMQSSASYNSDMITFSDVRSDDMQASMSGRLDAEYIYDFDYDDFDKSVWQLPYEIIRNANLLLSFVDDFEPTTDDEIAEVNAIRGHALALRALCHFDLVRMFGVSYSHNNGNSLGVPLIENVIDKYDKPKRNTVAEVYNSVVTDLSDAILLLPEGKSVGQLNAWGAKALLARVYLYMERNSDAYGLASDVIENGDYEIIKREDYLDSWSKEYTSESIFTLVNTAEDNGGLESVGYLSDPLGYGQFVASIDFIRLMDSKSDDIRSLLLIEDELEEDPGRVLKYPGIGNSMELTLKHQDDINIPLVNPTYVNNIDIIRLSEVCLIASEAALKNGNDQANAIKYLNMVVEERDETAVVVSDLTLDRILDERRVELVAEGHRFFDLVRNKRNIVRTMDGDRAWEWDEGEDMVIPWDYYMMIYPIPEDELLVNPMEQNPGYGSPIN